MTYYTGSLAPVPQANKAAYEDHASRAWPHFQKRGALRLVETWGEDIKPGKHTDFIRAVQAKGDEAVVFSWIEWPDRATADKAWAELMTDPAVEADMGQMPFDGKRMTWGGFAPVLSEGTDRGAGWVQGFLLAVPAANRQAYADMARQAWDGMFRPHGCLGMVEGWGEDVPHGTQTDMYRATDAKDGEVIVFSWTAWPDRATCEAAQAKTEADMDGQPMPEMPFDGKRMIWGGFAPLFDTAKG